MKKTNVTNVIILGGHFTPAFAVLEMLEKNRNLKIFYIGRRYSMEGDDANSLEYESLKNRQVEFIDFQAARFQRSLTRYTIVSLLKFPFTLVRSFLILNRIKPKVMVGFGGYVSLPFGLWSKILGIPLIIHEQTKVLGLANRAIARFAEVICLSYKKTVFADKYSKKTIYTGNPLRKELFADESVHGFEFGDKNRDLIYVTGGSQGSRAINRIISESLPELLSKYKILHQCGSANDQIDFQRLSVQKTGMDPKLAANYQVIPHVKTSEVGDIYRKSSLVIGRSGANTVSEVLFFQKPAVFIPLPWAADNEQYLNARDLETAGVARIINQKELTASVLGEAIAKLLGNRKKISQTFQKLSLERNTNPAEKIAEIICQKI
jgi:UDP-N-acetylglucosamine--N-acetylmuramyl-(pentapeptide) pyrophosphoryl-undecaprenol N-acetylglucosamine transferase